MPRRIHWSLAISFESDSPVRVEVIDTDSGVVKRSAILRPEKPRRRQDFEVPMRFPKPLNFQFRIGTLKSKPSGVRIFGADLIKAAPARRSADSA